MSLESLPSSVTSWFTTAVWSSPASATGGALPVVMTTVSGALSTWPSLTMSWISYTPSMSGMKRGETLVPDVRFAALPAGLRTKLQRKVSGSPSGSVESLPSSVISWSVNTVWSGPASAIGGRLVGEAHPAKVQRCVQVRASAEVILLSRSGSRGSVGPVAAWPRPFAIRLMSTLSMSPSASQSQTCGVLCAAATGGRHRRNADSRSARIDRSRRTRDMYFLPRSTITWMRRPEGCAVESDRG